MCRLLSVVCDHGFSLSEGVDGPPAPEGWVQVIRVRWPKAGQWGAIRQRQTEACFRDEQWSWEAGTFDQESWMILEEAKKKVRDRGSSRSFVGTSDFWI